MFETRAQNPSYQSIPYHRPYGGSNESPYAEPYSGQTFRQSGYNYGSPYGSGAGGGAFGTFGYGGLPGFTPNPYSKGLPIGGYASNYMPGYGQGYGGPPGLPGGGMPGGGMPGGGMPGGGMPGGGMGYGLSSMYSPFNAMYQNFANSFRGIPSYGFGYGVIGGTGSNPSGVNYSNGYGPYGYMGTRTNGASSSGTSNAASESISPSSFSSSKQS